MYNDIVIIGAGISGLGAGYKLGQRTVIYERENSYGGLCNSFSINGFRFDYAVHLSFTQDQLVRKLFDHTSYRRHIPKALNYSQGHWIPHPVQDNLYSLPVEERVKIIMGMINRPQDTDISNYEIWLKNQYGNYFSQHYPIPYTYKYWCCEPSELSLSWIGNRFSRPPIDEVIEFAMKKNNRISYYAKEMRYPEVGGYVSFLNPIAEHLNIQYNHEVDRIDIKNKEVHFKNGLCVKYKELISSMPLPCIIECIDNVPEEIAAAAKELEYTSICLVSIGFRKKINIPALWFYVYDLDIPYARAYSPSMKSSDNAPFGKSSLQFEIYYTKDKPLDGTKEEIITSVIASIVKMKICIEADIEVIDVRNVEFGNVVFKLGMERKRGLIRKYLQESGIYTIGRFGEWDYLWSDQSFLSGYNYKIGK